MKIEVHEKSKVSPADLWLLVIDRETRVADEFSNLKLDGFTVIESSLRQCTFEEVRVRSACFGGGMRQSVFEDCAFSRCKFAFGAVGNIR